MEFPVKEEIFQATGRRETRKSDGAAVAKAIHSVIDLSSSSSSDDSDSGDDLDDLVGGVFAFQGDGRVAKKRKLGEVEEEVVLPLGFLASLPPEDPLPISEEVAEVPAAVNMSLGVREQSCRQFWKAGDYEGASSADLEVYSVGMDHVRVHPKFLHSNATSHKWALGAFAELLDNSLDEVCNGATYVNMDMLRSDKVGGKMLLIEDDGGGMDPDKMRQCMSLGYSAKSKVANTIGQYGNGFKTSTMRLGADVIVFSRCCGIDGKSSTQSIGLLSYTFLRSTGKEDIIVPMLDYERRQQEWSKIVRSSLSDWDRNMETIVQWSPFSSERDLLCQFDLIKDHGTRIIIYNLWEDDEGLSELDFDADPHDIQLRGVNRDEKKIKMAKEFPNSRHFLTYRHSLRSYASILYLRLPSNFRIILRGKDVEHHNIVNDMMLAERVTYRPQDSADGVPKDSNMAAVVTIGFVKDAKFHIDVQGFNVYHKNRLIKPFWRVWNAAGSGGRGIIGVLEANFVEPAHDKQGFERTKVLSRLEARLIQMQKTYWNKKRHKIGYASNHNAKQKNQSSDRECSLENDPQRSFQSKDQGSPCSMRNSSQSVGKVYTGSRLRSEGQPETVTAKCGGGFALNKADAQTKTLIRSGKAANSFETLSPLVKNVSKEVYIALPAREANGSSQKTSTKKSNKQCAVYGSEHQQNFKKSGRTVQPVIVSQSKEGNLNGFEHPLSKTDSGTLEQLKQENRELRDRCRSLESELKAADDKVEELNQEQESLIEIFSEERDRRNKEEENLRKKLKEASNTIQELLEKIKTLEKWKSLNGKPLC
ncbi:hypothetical protein SLEP1_g29287 [Rubroshorea leprosula]|uniref:Morc S5 domain-containing protein n=1 Tax=Rubroshorea leprosula TaxID=152421 RepID=A0AAV5JWG1_9ROSI|nr:hypothetical protein SLEP1_g29287 [Rubroshorea leprosula]